MQADCETQKSVPTVRWGFPWQPQQREDTGLPSLSLSHPFSLSLSLSVSRVIKDCTLINFSALSRAKCPGRGLCVWVWMCVCVCTCVYVNVFMCMLRALLCMRPWLLNTSLSSIQRFFTFAHKYECVCVLLCLYEHNHSFKFLLQTIFPFKPLCFSLLCHAPSSSLTASKQHRCTNTHPKQVYI